MSLSDISGNYKSNRIRQLERTLALSDIEMSGLRDKIGTNPGFLGKVILYAAEAETYFYLAQLELQKRGY